MTKERKRNKIFKIISKSKKGYTVADIASLLCEPFSWVAPRVSELEKAGVICRTGEKRINSDSGKMCNVFKVVGR